MSNQDPLFRGLHFTVDAGFSAADSNQIKSLIIQYGGKIDYTVGAKTNVLVSTQRSLSLNTTKVVAAAKRHIPIVSQSFVLDSIQAGIVQPQQSYIIVEHLPSHVSQAVDSPSKKAKLAEVESDGDEAVPADDAATTKKKSHTKQALGKWRTARVFISSTFRDMHGERDYLTRYVFPELQDRCNKLRVHVHPVDLRWGVTEEDTANALELCLTEIDSCRPFFIGLLGDRYGWRPDRYIVPDEPRFDWVQAMPPGLSITHMEMFYGVLRDPARANYAFYIRDSSFLQNAPSEYIDDFKTESMEHKYNLERLKEDIRTKLDPSMVFDSYPCSWGGVVDGKPMTGALEAFGSHVLDTMWKQMQSQFAAESNESDPLFADRAYHEQFIESHSRLFIGRQSLLDTILRYAKQPNISGDMLVIIGEPGSGKTSLVSSFANSFLTSNRDKDDTFVLIHFVGAAPGSTNIRQTLSRLVRELIARFEFDDAVPEDYKDLKALFVSLIAKIGEQKSTDNVVLILDALNQLEETYQSHSLDWIPERLPANVRVVVSTLKGDVYENLQRRSVQELRVGALTASEQQEIVEKTLWEYRKKLTAAQMQQLLQKSDAYKPLYLVVACEELRVFGVFEKLSERIQEMAQTVPNLFAEVLQRLEGDHSKELIADTMSLLASSRGGLLEEEVLHLLGPSMDYPLPQSAWSRIYRSLRAYLRPVSESGEGVLDFFHQQLPKAVRRRYLADKDFERSIHAKLAAFFQMTGDPDGDKSWSAGNRRGLGFSPYHQINAEKWVDLSHALCNLAFIEAKCEAGMTFDLVADYLLAQSRKELIPATIYESLEEYQRFVQQRSHVLARNSELCFSMAASLPDESKPAKEAASRYRQRIERRPWMRWANKPQTANPCIMTLSGHEAVIRACSYSPIAPLIASASDDKTIRIWNAATGEESKTLKGHSNSVICCEFSPDGQFLASAGYDKYIKVWNAQTGDEVISLRGHRGMVNGLAWNYSGTLLATASQDKTVKIWNPWVSPDEACVHTISEHTRVVRTVAFSYDGLKLATGCEDGTLRLFDANDFSFLCGQNGHAPRGLNHLSFCSTPGKEHMLVTAGDDRAVKVWDTNDLSLIHTFTGHHDGVTSAVFSADGERVLSASHDNLIICYQLKSGASIANLIGHTGSVFRAVFSTDGKYIVSCSFDRSVKIWEVRDEVAQGGHEARILSMAFSPDAKFLATGSRDKTIKLWDATSGKELRQLKGHGSNVFGVAWSHDGVYLASASRDKLVKIWNPHNGECLITLTGHTQNAIGVEWLLGLGFGHTALKIPLPVRSANCQAMLGRLSTSVGDHEGTSPDGNHLLSCSDDKLILIWDAVAILAARKPGVEVTLDFEKVGLAKLFGHHNFVNQCHISPDGRRAISASADGSLKLWDTRSMTKNYGKAYVKVATFSGHTKPVNAAAFSPDSSTVASGGDDCDIILWNTKNAVKKATLVRHTAPITDIAYTPDSKYIFSGSTDNTCMLWNTATLKPDCAFACLSRVCAVAVSNRAGLFAAGDGSGMLYILSPVDL